MAIDVYVNDDEFDVQSDRAIDEVVNAFTELRKSDVFGKCCDELALHTRLTLLEARIRLGDALESFLNDELDRAYGGGGSGTERRTTAYGVPDGELAVNDPFAPSCDRTVKMPRVGG